MPLVLLAKQRHPVPVRKTRGEQLAESFEPAFQRAFLRNVAKLLTTAQVRDLAAAVNAQDKRKALAILRSNTVKHGLRAMANELRACYRDLIEAAGKQGAQELVRQVSRVGKADVAKAKKPKPKKRTGGGSVNFTFDIDQTRPIAYIDRKISALTDSIADDMQRGILETIRRGSTEGLTVAQQAKIIRYQIGLTDNQDATLGNRYQSRREGGMSAGRAGQLMADEAEKMLRDRAETIARTETSYAQNFGHLESIHQARDMGILGDKPTKTWVGSETESTEFGACEACGFLSRDGGKTIALDEDFKVDDYDPVPCPPLHPRCFPGDALVLSIGGVAGVSKRAFNGDLVTLVAGEHKLTCTPNHPVLTSQGWVAASLVNPGSYLVSAMPGQRKFFANQYQKNGPTNPHQISDLADKLAMPSRTCVPVSAEDFHGDGANSKVAIIASNGFLRGDGKTTTTQHANQPPLGWRSLCANCLNRLRATAMLGKRHLAAAHRSMRSIGESFALLGRGPGHAQNHGVMAVSRSNASLPEMHNNGTTGNAFAFRNSLDRNTVTEERHDPLRIDRLAAGLFRTPGTRVSDPQVDASSADTKLARQLLAGRAGKVSFHKVTRVNVHTFSGHVFNLQTDSGAYLAHGLVVHNCRCTLSYDPGFGDDADD